MLLFAAASLARALFVRRLPCIFILGLSVQRGAQLSKVICTSPIVLVFRVIACVIYLSHKRLVLSTQGARALTRLLDAPASAASRHLGLGTLKLLSLFPFQLLF